MLTILWLVVSGIYLVKMRQLKSIKGTVGGVVSVSLIFLGIDAAQNIIESVYYGLFFNFLYGLTPKIVNDLLLSTSWLIIFKLINVTAGILVIWYLIKHWLPRELDEREETRRALDEAKIEAANAQKLFSSIFNCSTDGFIITNEHRIILSVNQSFIEMFGYSNDELVGKKVSIIYEGDAEYERHGRMYFNLSAGEKVKPYEANYRHKNGKTVIGETVRIVIKDTVDQIQGYMGFIRDVTERNTTSMKLQISESMLSHHIQNTPLGYLSWGKDANCIEINKSAEDIFGYSANEIRGHSLLDLLVPEKIKDEIENICNSLLKGNEKSISINLNENITKDGMIIICEWHNTPIVNNSGDVIGVTSLVQDVTEKIRTQKTLEETEKKFREQSQRYAEVIWAANIGTWEWNLQTGEIIFNQRVAEMLGYGQQQLASIDIDIWQTLMHPDDANYIKHLINKCLKRQTDNLESEFRVKHRNGSWIWVLDRGRVVEWTANDKPMRMSGTYQDITKAKQSEDVRKLAANVFTYAKEGIAITDTAGVIIEVNAAFTGITGYTRDEVIGKNPRILKSGTHLPEFYADMWTTLQQKGHWSGEIWNKRKNGEVFPEILTISTVLDDNGVVQNYVALFNDITAIKAHQRQLERIAHYDMLTNLPNRTLLADRLTQSIIRGQRQNSLVAVAFLDLDRFKKVNDRYGHIIGDELLIVVSTRLKDALRDECTVARIGGDEFVAVIENINTVSDCEPILERMLLAASEPIDINGIRLDISASIGVAIYPEDGADADQLMRNADQAMYVAKQQGKNRYHLFDSAHNTAMVIQHKKLEGIRNALKNEEFILYYQPKVNMRTGTIIGVEALIRWQSPELGLVSPNEFLPIIENNVLVIEVGEWVISSALGQIELWKTLGLDIPISVNISALQLQSDDFVTRLADLLAAYPDIDTSSLELEVLETSAIGDLIQVSKTMHACIALGVNFALDDFGTGYSSLSYLRSLPANLIKIDQTFVYDMLVDPEDLAIVESVVVLAKSFDREVIAEGVETVEHGVALLQLGCELAQGYAIARPMMAKDVPEWAANWQPYNAWRE
ncbi:PAS domain S-box protein [Shewanella sp. SM32]|uniref:PAS domain S-box protein n=1 Tax=Shewanella sp. SM32 TaxID=2912796 RepID=UPI0021DAD0C8|nr:PAS domain S-box protein [Shewanella sp. SM32]MCU8072349.1 PAS domain S-box protein [Shewanella sp. SM32]